MWITFETPRPGVGRCGPKIILGGQAPRASAVLGDDALCDPKSVPIEIPVVEEFSAGHLGESQQPMCRDARPSFAADQPDVARDRPFRCGADDRGVLADVDAPVRNLR